MDWERVFIEIRTLNWATLLVLGLISYFLMSSAFTLGVIFGGLIIIANFYMLQRTIRTAFGPDGALKGKKKIIIAKYYFRLAIVGIIIYMLIAKALVDPIGLTMGLSTVVISILSFGIRTIWKTSF